MPRSRQPQARRGTALALLVRRFAFTTWMIALAIDVRRLFHRFALRAAIFSGTHGAGTHRVRALAVFSDRHWSPPAASHAALALLANVALSDGASHRAIGVFGRRRCPTPCTAAYGDWLSRGALAPLGDV